ncbi:uncharacterized protein LOC135612380 [Musa acuminata AAA Group]|uniref:uncharacterized protein LOC135612380 n=1 Tax=Musa acuminata AAA Group TaxID=214697 RepID=UPI0031D2008A
MCRPVWLETNLLEGKRAKRRRRMSGEEEDDFDEGVVVGQLSTVMVPKHIKKRALRNKALTVGFNDKELRDFVTGFHKRKKKRRKEAQRQLQEKDRLKRIEARKKVSAFLVPFHD